MTTTIRGRIVLPDEVLEGGWLAVEDDRVAGLGVGEPPGPSIDLAGSWVLPGFVDLHVHGGGGHTVTAGDVEAARKVAEFHLGHGTTALLASLVTGPAEQMLAATSALAGWLERGRDGSGDGQGATVVGVHLEGPFLSRSWCGAQDPRWVRPPDREELEALVQAGRGTVRVVTLAPELPGALELISYLRSAGIVAGVGHTDALYSQASAAFTAGASLVTHVCNGMRPAHHREPGVAGAAFDATGVVCEMILDGVHLHPATARAVVRNRGRDQVALITDAMDAAGREDGQYDLGGQRVRVEDGVARLERNGSLAGSTLTMDAAVRYAVTELGLPVADVSRMASLVPAQVLGMDSQVGSLEPGKHADLVVLDDRWHVVAVVSRGRVAHGAQRLGTDRLG